MVSEDTPFFTSPVFVICILGSDGFSLVVSLTNHSTVGLGLPSYSQESVTFSFSILVSGDALTKILDGSNEDKTIINTQITEQYIVLVLIIILSNCSSQKFHSMLNSPLFISFSEDNSSIGCVVPDNLTYITVTYSFCISLFVHRYLKIRLPLFGNFGYILLYNG